MCSLGGESLLLYEGVYDLYHCLYEANMESMTGERN